MNDINIRFMDDDVRYPVYCLYDGQNKPQDAFIVISPNGNPQVYATFNSEIGNEVPVNHSKGKEYWLKIPSAVSGHSINEFIKENGEIIRTIIDGYTEEAGFNLDAQEAFEQLEWEVGIWYDFGMWDLPGDDDVDIHGHVIVDWNHTLRKTSKWKAEDGTHIEIEYYDPYGHLAGGSEWCLDNDGNWILINPNSVSESQETSMGLDAEDVRKYVNDIHEVGEITASFRNCSVFVKTCKNN